jgi:hypothetical protein
MRVAKVRNEFNNNLNIWRAVTVNNETALFSHEI